jgi:hypothetical protein
MEECDSMGSCIWHVKAMLPAVRVKPDNILVIAHGMNDFY